MTLLLVGGVSLILILAAYMIGYAQGNRDGWTDAQRSWQPSTWRRLSDVVADLEKRGL